VRALTWQSSANLSTSRSSLPANAGRRQCAGNSPVLVASPWCNLPTVRSRKTRAIEAASSSSPRTGADRLSLFALSSEPALKQKISFTEFLLCDIRTTIVPASLPFARAANCAGFAHIGSGAIGTRALRFESILSAWNHRFEPE